MQYQAVSLQLHSHCSALSIFQLQQPSFRRFHFFLKLLESSWMGEIAVSDNADALQFRPARELFGHEVLACRNGEMGVYMKVADETQGLFLSINEKTNTMYVHYNPVIKNPSFA